MSELRSDFTMFDNIRYSSELLLNKHDKNSVNMEDTGVYQRVNHFLRRRQISSAKKYQKLFTRKNQIEGCEKYFVAITDLEPMRLGIGTFGLPIQLLGIFAIVLPYLPGVNWFPLWLAVPIFAVLLIGGFVISLKFENKHFGALPGVAVFTEIIAPMLGYILIILFLFSLFYPVAAALH